MTTVILLGLAFFACISLWGAVNPRSLWRAGQWAYKHPDANEPSDKAFTVQRFTGAISFVLFLVLIVLVAAIL